MVYHTMTAILMIIHYYYSMFTVSSDSETFISKTKSCLHTVYALRQCKKKKTMYSVGKTVANTCTITV